MQSVVIKIRVAELNEAGHWLLDSIRQQDRWLASILHIRSQPGIIYAEINDEDTDDILKIRVDDLLGHAKRIQHFGGGSVHGSPEEQEQMFGVHAMSAATRRQWFIPQSLITRARTNPDDGAAIINEAGIALRDWCNEGHFVVWRNPDWVSQAEAAKLVGVAESTIRNAVRDGRLDTWKDSDEPNPQRNTRVRRSDVQQRWGLPVEQRQDQ